MTSRGLFAEDFGHAGREPAAVPAPVAEPELAPEVVPLDEHKRQCAEAWAKGQEAGAAAVRAETGAQALEMLTRIEQLAADARETWLAEARASADALARMLCAGLAAGFPALCARHGAAEVQAAIGEILPALLHEPELYIHAAPTHVGAINTLLERKATAAKHIHLVPDADLADCDFRLEWPRGEARRDSDQIWSRIEAILAPQGLLPATTTVTEPEREAADVD